jgi:hypothetical protein
VFNKWMLRRELPSLHSFRRYVVVWATTAVGDVEQPPQRDTTRNGGFPKWSCGWAAVVVDGVESGGNWDRRNKTNDTLH